MIMNHILTTDLFDAQTTLVLIVSSIWVYITRHNEAISRTTYFYRDPR